MGSPINSMMLRRASMRRPSVSHWARATREFTTGPSRSLKTRLDILLECLLVSACQQRTFCIRQVVPWKKKMKPPKCTSARTVTSALASRGRVIMTGRQTLALLTRLVTFKHIPSVTVSRSCWTEQRSQSCPSALRKPSLRRSLWKRSSRIRKPLHKTCSAPSKIWARDKHHSQKVTHLEQWGGIWTGTRLSASMVTRLSVSCSQTPTSQNQLRKTARIKFAGRRTLTVHLAARPSALIFHTNRFVRWLTMQTMAMNLKL